MNCRIQGQLLAVSFKMKGITNTQEKSFFPVEKFGNKPKSSDVTRVPDGSRAVKGKASKAKSIASVKTYSYMEKI